MDWQKSKSNGEYEDELLTPDSFLTCKQGRNWNGSRMQGDCEIVDRSDASGSTSGLGIERGKLMQTPGEHMKVGRDSGSGVMDGAIHYANDDGETDGQLQTNSRIRDQQGEGLQQGLVYGVPAQYSGAFGGAAMTNVMYPQQTGLIQPMIQTAPEMGAQQQQQRMAAHQPQYFIPVPVYYRQGQGAGGGGGVPGPMYPHPHAPMFYYYPPGPTHMGPTTYPAMGGVEWAAQPQQQLIVQQQTQQQQEQDHEDLLHGNDVKEYHHQQQQETTLPGDYQFQQPVAPPVWVYGNNQADNFMPSQIDDSVVYHAQPTPRTNPTAAVEAQAPANNSKNRSNSDSKPLKRESRSENINVKKARSGGSSRRSPARSSASTSIIPNNSAPNRRAASSSVYRGVSWHKRDKRWTARAWIRGKASSCGSYFTELVAAVAVDLKTLELLQDKTEAEVTEIRGQLNFPTNDHRNNILRQELMDNPRDMGIFQQAFPNHAVVLELRKP